MAKQTIGIGSSANDGTGDPLRTAFDKANDNFDELYSGRVVPVPTGGDETTARPTLESGAIVAWLGLTDTDAENAVSGDLQPGRVETSCSARREPVGVAGDIYQVAGVLYFALVGTPPFARARTADVVFGLSGGYLF